MKPLDDDEVPTDSLTRELQRLTEKFLDDQVSARKSKWRESSMVTSVKVSMDTSQPHVIKCVDEHKYVFAPHVSSSRCTIYAAFRSPLMKAVDRSVKTLGL